VISYGARRSENATERAVLHFARCGSTPPTATRQETARFPHRTPKSRIVSERQECRRGLAEDRSRSDLSSSRSIQRVECWIENCPIVLAQTMHGPSVLQTKDQPLQVSAVAMPILALRSLYAALMCEAKHKVRGRRYRLAPGVLVAVLCAMPAFGQEPVQEAPDAPATRADAIAAARAEKVAELWPERQNALVGTVDGLVERGSRKASIRERGQTDRRLCSGACEPARG
jgi:hypothetical protein